MSQSNCVKFYIRVTHTSSVSCIYAGIEIIQQHKRQEGWKEEAEYSVQRSMNIGMSGKKRYGSCRVHAFLLLAFLSSKQDDLQQLLISLQAISDNTTEAMQCHTMQNPNQCCY